jgi:hypothetical protein
VLREPAVTTATKRTQQLHGVSTEPRNGTLAEAEAVGKAERNMSGTDMRGTAAPPGSGTTSRAKGLRRKLGDPASDRSAKAAGPHRESEEL